MARSKVTAAPLLPEIQDFAYRGYLVKHNPIRSEFYMSKGGVHIGTVRSKDEAKRTIDLLAWQS